MQLQKILQQIKIKTKSDVTLNVCILLLMQIWEMKFWIKKKVWSDIKVWFLHKQPFEKLY